LMKATGLKKGGIYRHFSSKEELAGEAFDYSWSQAIHGRTAGLDEVPDCPDRLKKMIDNFVEKREGLVPGGCPLMNTAVETDDGNSQLRARAKKALNHWTALLSKIISEGISKNQIDRRVDPHKLSQLIIGSLEGALFISRLQKDRTPLDGSRRHLRDYLDQSVCAKPHFSRRGNLS
jgi:TetR/AcrR family transcriptional repressor of nem operon